MLRMIVVAFALSTPALVHAQTAYYSYAFAKQYTFNIDHAALEKTPDWDPEVADNPPVSAKNAIRMARELKDTLVKDSKDFKWKLDTATLHPLNRKWIWLVQFNAQYQGPSSGYPNHLQFVILMDGTIIKPTIRDDPRFAR